MVACHVYKLLHCLIKRFLCSKGIKTDAAIFQSIKISLYWRSVIRVSRFTHAMRDMDGFAVFYKRF